jgi:hypothetical protein
MFHEESCIEDMNPGAAVFRGGTLGQIMSSECSNFINGLAIDLFIF